MSQETKNLYVHFSFGSHGTYAIRTEIPKVISQAKIFFANPIPGQRNVFITEDSSGRIPVVEFQQTLIAQGMSLLEAGAQGGYFRLNGIPAEPADAKKMARKMLMSKEDTFGIHLVEALDRIRGRNGINFDWDSEAYPDDITTQRMAAREEAKGRYSRARIALYAGDYANAALEGRQMLAAEQTDISFRNNGYLAMIRKIQNGVTDEACVKVMLRIGNEHDVLFDRMQSQGILNPPQLSKSYTRPNIMTIRKEILRKIEQAPWATIDDKTALIYLAYVELIDSQPETRKVGFGNAEIAFNQRYPRITGDEVLEAFKRIIASSDTRFKNRMAERRKLASFDEGLFEWFI